VWPRCTTGRFAIIISRGVSESSQSIQYLPLLAELHELNRIAAEFRLRRIRQPGLQQNPARHAGPDFNALDNAVLNVIEPGHESTDVIAELEIGQG